MRVPDVYAVNSLRNWDVDTEIHTGVWVPARPMSRPGINIIRRFKIAWNVFIGKWDAVEWYRQ